MKPIDDHFVAQCARRWGIKAIRAALGLRLTWVAICGLLTELIYAGYFLRTFYLPSYYLTPLQDLGKLTAYERSAGAIFVSAIIALFGLYYAAFRLVRSSDAGHRKSIVWLVIVCALIFSSTLLLVYPYGAADIFDYVFFGRILAQHGANPFLYVPTDFGADPFLPYVAWRRMPFAYGPLWAMLSGGLSWLGGDDLFANLILYKGLVIVSYLASLALIYAILRRLAPRYAPAGLLLFAWNPLVLTEVAANGHNDVVMVAVALLAVLLALGDKRWIAGIGLAGTAAAALTKFATAMVAPLFAVSLWRRSGSAAGRLTLLAISLAGAAALTVAAYTPFWQGWPTLLGLSKHREELYTTSFAALAKQLLEAHAGITDAKFVGIAFLAAFGAYCLIEAWRLAPGVEALVAASYRVTLIYLLFASQWFQPWYLIWLLGFAAIRPGLNVANLSVIFSFSALLNYFVFDYVYLWTAPRFKLVDVQYIAVAVIYSPPLAYLFGRRFRRFRRARALAKAVGQCVE